ncbi:hypothetical protein M8J75_013117 [Diaphorina citri]|nr:hypothetical protein M8J75_013117 [Diaphorina citri]KAI5753705.1 hypothetical protein M8J77_002631 [Diaphorina citri]
MSDSNTRETEEDKVVLETSDCDEIRGEKCFTLDSTKDELTKMSENKNNDENPKSINDNNEQVNRINEEERCEEEERQIMQIKKIDDKDYQEKRGEKVMVNLMREHPFAGLSADDNQKVTLDGHSEQLQEDIPKPSTIPKTDGSGETNDNETKPITAERNMSTEFSQKAKAYDSVSVYSNQDFSQISDCSDEEIIDMCRKLSNHGLRDNTDGKSLGLEMEQGTCGSPLEGPVEPHAEIVEKYYDAHDGISHYEKDSTSRSRSNKSDFHTTNARIHGDFQEDTKKRGIRVLQPPGGFSSGLW